jgi:hypothetical protein
VIVAASAALLALLLVAGVWWRVADDGVSRPATSPPDQTASNADETWVSTTMAEPLAPTTSSPGGGVDVYAEAAVAPAVVAPGERFSLAPVGVVDRLCHDYASVYRFSEGSYEQVAQAAPIGFGWQLSDEVIPYTVPGCFQGPSDVAAEFEVPADMPEGVYVICLSPTPSGESCGPLHISDTTPGPPAVASTPSAAASGVTALPIDTNYTPSIAVGPPPVPTVAYTYIDEQGHRCLELRTSDGSQSGMCVDEPEDLATSGVGGDDHATGYLLGTTSRTDGDHVVVDTPNGPIRVDLQVIPGWPERAFAIHRPDGITAIHLIDTDGVTIATSTAS